MQYGFPLCNPQLRVLSPELFGAPLRDSKDPPLNSPYSTNRTTCAEQLPLKRLACDKYATCRRFQCGDKEFPRKRRILLRNMHWVKGKVPRGAPLPNPESTELRAVTPPTVLRTRATASEFAARGMPCIYRSADYLREVRSPRWQYTATRYAVCPKSCGKE